MFDFFKNLDTVQTLFSGTPRLLLVKAIHLN